MTYFRPTKYVKDESFDPIFKSVDPKVLLKTSIVPSAILFLSVFTLTTQVVMPLISFKTENTVSRPVASSALGQATGFSEFKFSELNKKDVLGTTTAENVPEYFYITIPKLNIENAKVETNESTLQPDDAIGHYPNSALPGETGNSFLFGHSVLPFFYNPDNYKTIFSTIGKLEAGDLIYVKYNNRKLTYKVEGKRTLKPEKVDPLAELKPSYLNESTMVLMTCSPPGTKIYRLLVDTVLVN